MTDLMKKFKKMLNELWNSAFDEGYETGRQSQVLSCAWNKYRKELGLEQKVYTKFQINETYFDFTERCLGYGQPTDSTTPNMDGTTDITYHAHGEILMRWQPKGKMHKNLMAYHKRGHVE